MIVLVTVLLSTLLFVTSVISENEKTYYTKLHKSDDLTCRLLTFEILEKFRGFETDDAFEVVIRDYPAVSSIDPIEFFRDHSTVIEVYSKQQNLLWEHLDTVCNRIIDIDEPSEEGDTDGVEPNATPEIIKIVNTGPSKNRIDVVFMGDGYTSKEREEFIGDMQRLTTDMFEGITFKSWLPLFNIWAVFVPSQESGIGYNGAKKTAFKLYREKGQLRGVYTGNAAYARQVCKLTGTSGCDYPSLIGNDDYYGGLGGEFVISTRSNRTGTMVLRHEMGHNFIKVGEEYDNGQVYRGVNAASFVSNLGWKHWLTAPAREERAMYRILEYPWHDLSKGPKTFRFVSDGSYSTWHCIASVTAAAESDSLEFALDGKVLPWTSSGSDDREFYDFYGSKGFSAGTHTFTVKSRTIPTNKQIPRMIGSLSCHEFGSEAEYVMDNEHISAYPTWDVLKRKTFRPTPDGCLMRNMTHPKFCNVCKEGMWYQFLQRVSLIDRIDVQGRDVTVHTLKLGQWRPQEIEGVDGETMQVRWFFNNQEITSLRDQLQGTGLDKGQWKVNVKLITPEVRADPKGLLQDSEIFNV